MDPKIIKEIRRTYILARALNIQYQFIRDYLNNDLKKAINDAKARNAFFIKTIDEKFDKRNHREQVDKDEELAYQFLEYLDNVLENKNQQ